MTLLKKLFGSAAGPAGTPSTREKGNAGEEEAVKFLKKNNFRILARNYRKKFGEIDIICMDNATLVFVEVKASRHDSFGPPEFRINERKQRQIARAASAYLLEHGITDRECRFDVIGITFAGNSGPDFVHLRDAFRLE